MKNKSLYYILGMLIVLGLTGCDNMRDGNRFKPYEETPFFENGSTAREPVVDTVPRGFLREDKHLYEGKNAAGEFETKFPFPITEQILARGKNRYDIYCLVCHGVTGAGDGMVVRRGYKVPIAFQEDKIKNLPAGYLFHVTTEGFGVMAGFKSELTPEDRWAVAAYTQTLQNIETKPAETKTA